MVINEPEKKNIALAVSLILKELLVLFCGSSRHIYQFEYHTKENTKEEEENSHSKSVITVNDMVSPADKIHKISEEVVNGPKYPKLIEKFLIKLANEISVMPDIPEKYRSMIFHNNRTQNLDKQDSSLKNSQRHGGEGEYKSSSLGHDLKKGGTQYYSSSATHQTLILNLMNKEYQPPDSAEGVHNKAEAYQTEHSICLCLKNELYFLCSRWLKVCKSDAFIIKAPIKIIDHVVADLQSVYKPALFENAMICINSFSKQFTESCYKIVCEHTDFFLSLLQSLRDESEAVELMKTLTNLLLQAVSDDPNKIFKLEKHLSRYFKIALKADKIVTYESKTLRASSSQNQNQLPEFNTDEIEKIIRESMLWIVSAIFEQNYGEEIIKVYGNIGVPEMITPEMINDFKSPNLVKIKNLNSSDPENFDFNIDEYEFDDYDEQIKMLEEKYDLEEAMTEEQIAKIIEKELGM